MAFAIEAAGDIGFEYRTVPIKAITVKEVKNEATNRIVGRDVEIDGDYLKGSDRFWTSLFARYGFNKAFFEYFTPAETFERIAQHHPDEQLRVCVEKGKQSSRVLAVSAPDRAIVGFDDLYKLLEDNGGQQCKYDNGIVTSMQTPTRAMPDFEIADSAFQYQFCLSTPLDGYGAPNIYLALLRQVCSNGAIAMAPAFKSEVKLGKKDDDIMTQMLRALDSFNNEEGFLALRQRFEAATKSYASIFEAQSLYDILTRQYSKGAVQNALQLDPGNTTLIRALEAEELERTIGRADDGESVIGSQAIRAYHQLTGNLTHEYGLANLDALSQKRQRTLPTRATVYDLINLSTEIATHYAIPGASRQLQGWVGGLLANEYDMENTKEKFADFADFHMERKLAAGLTGSHPELN